MQSAFPLRSPDFYADDPCPAYRELRVTSPDGSAPDSVHEFTGQIAAPLPTRTIAELSGALPDDRVQFRAWSNAASPFSSLPVRRTGYGPPRCPGKNACQYGWERSLDWGHGSGGSSQ